LIVCSKKGQEEESDEEYDPRGGKKHPKESRAKASSVSLAEQGRGELHTLQEDHNYLLSSPLDDAFQDGAGIGPSSSQLDGFRFSDDFLEGMDLGGDIGDELARALGDGWGVSPKADM
jgi:meiotic recombination protein REC8, fungi type